MRNMSAGFNLIQLNCLQLGIHWNLALGKLSKANVSTKTWMVLSCISSCILSQRVLLAQTIFAWCRSSRDRKARCEPSLLSASHSPPSRSARLLYQDHDAIPMRNTPHYWFPVLSIRQLGGYSAQGISNARCWCLSQLWNWIFNRSNARLDGEIREIATHVSSLHLADRVEIPADFQAVEWNFWVAATCSFANFWRIGLEDMVEI